MTPPPGRLDFTFTFAPDGKEAKKHPAPGVGHVLFIAPYSGAARSSAKTTNFAVRPLQLEEAFRIVASEVQLQSLTPGGNPFPLRLVDAHSLHPDALLDTVPSLTELWKPLRDLERDPSSVERLAQLVASHHTAALGTKSPPEAAGDLLNRLLGQRPSESRQSGTPQTDGVSVAAAQELVQQFAARLLSQDTSATVGGALESSRDLRMKAELELGRRLRELLRQQAYQSVSAAWLATEMVVRSCPDESRARFSAVDASWTELVSAPSDFAALLDSGASVVMVDHCFGPASEELCGLVELVRACHERRVFFVTGATLSLAGLEDRFLQNPTETEHDVERWQADWSDEARAHWVQLASLREQGAQFSLALPRYLVRHPFGKYGEPLETFAFEELEGRPESGQFLWANGAYLVARALMEQWCGEEAKMDGSYEIGGLPVANVPDDNGRRMQPPIEVSLPRSTVDQLLDQGFSIVEVYRDSDRVHVYV